MRSEACRWGRTSPQFRDFLHFSAELLLPETTEVPHGHRNPRIHPGGGRGGDRPLRLRLPDANGAERPGPHPGRAAFPPKREVPQDIRPDRCRVPVLHVPAAHASVPPSPFQGARDPGRCPRHVPQPRVHASARRRYPRSHLAGDVCGVQTEPSFRATMLEGDDRNAETEGETTHARLRDSSQRRSCCSALPFFPPRPSRCPTRRRPRHSARPPRPPRLLHRFLRGSSRRRCPTGASPMCMPGTLGRAWTARAWYTGCSSTPSGSASRAAWRGSTVQPSRRQYPLHLGDLVFFDTTEQQPLKSPTHVGVYIGNGKIVHAASEGLENRRDRLRSGRSYYRDRFIGARRVCPGGSPCWTSPSRRKIGQRRGRAIPVPGGGHDPRLQRNDGRRAGELQPPEGRQGGARPRWIVPGARSPPRCPSKPPSADGRSASARIFKGRTLSDVAFTVVE